METEWFPSPTGLNFNKVSEDAKKVDMTFPSPHGDKFQRVLNAEASTVLWFSSPHGDKFQHSDESFFD